MEIEGQRIRYFMKIPQIIATKMEQKGNIYSIIEIRKENKLAVNYVHRQRQESSISSN